ncbi:SLAM family member 9-like [Vombatus ursinus]|uniref:Immunoglobulin subtype domain-containing protein n=1 Tax=Vombatus ursinus TaxID=29139 RepID=A0A4X2JW92_VOMUR|nr:SLAM family member 9-like [Vombatus ursinus]
MIHPRLWTLFLLSLLLGPGGSKGIAGPGELIGIVGESITLPLEIMAGEKVENITWISQTLVAVVYSGQGRKPANITQINPLYVGRLNVPTHSYSLEISALRMEDAGSYRALITIQTCSVGTNKKFILSIHDSIALAHSASSGSSSLGKGTFFFGFLGVLRIGQV